jgi:LysR family transcriptional activator for leuABCD operon
MLTNKTNQTNTVSDVRMESTLRGVDLNLLTVFDAVMQEQNITRAAYNLNMSQPAVSNAVARLKIMFKDELFMRQGRGIQPTQRARQLFGPIRQALQLVRNELPGSTFHPESSTRSFSVSIASPNDVRLAASILSNTAESAPHVRVQLDAEIDNNIQEKLRYHETDFVIDYSRFDGEGFASTEIFSDELVVVAAKTHPRINGQITLEQLLSEKHAKLTRVNGVRNFTESAYKGLECQVAYRGVTPTNLVYVVAQSELITIAPRWVTEQFTNDSAGIEFQVMEMPTQNKSIKAYLSWHQSSEKDTAHVWMRDHLMEICGEVVEKERQGS